MMRLVNLISVAVIISSALAYKKFHKQTGPTCGFMAINNCLQEDVFKLGTKTCNIKNILCDDKTGSCPRHFGTPPAHLDPVKANAILAKKKYQLVPIHDISTNGLIAAFHDEEAFCIIFDLKAEPYFHATTLTKYPQIATKEYYYFDSNCDPKEANIKTEEPLYQTASKSPIPWSQQIKPMDNKGLTQFLQSKLVSKAVIYQAFKLETMAINHVIARRTPPNYLSAKTYPAKTYVADNDYYDGAYERDYGFNDEIKEYNTYYDHTGYGIYAVTILTSLCLCGIIMCLVYIIGAACGVGIGYVAFGKNNKNNTLKDGNLDQRELV